MSSFEFLSVLISVVVGLGIANLLSGVARLLNKTRVTHLSGAHIVWTIFVFLFTVVYWWTVVFGWKDWQNWNIVLFLFLLGYGVLVYLLSVILYPTDVPETWDTSEHFIGMRRWFFGVFILMLAAEFSDSLLKGHLDELGVPYLFVIGSWLTVAVIGWTSTSRKIHFGIAIYQLLSLLAWVGYQLRDLDWSFR